MGGEEGDVGRALHLAAVSVAGADFEGFLEAVSWDNGRTFENREDNYWFWYWYRTKLRPKFKVKFRPKCRLGF